MESRAGVAVGAAGAEAGLAEDLSIPSSAAGMHAGCVAAQSGFVRIGFEEGDSCKMVGEDVEAHDEFVIRDIIESIAADDEVVGIAEIGKVSQRALDDIAALAKPPDGIRAGIDTGVSEAGAELFQDRLPLAFTASDIEDAAHRAFEIILRHGECEECLAGRLRGSDDAVFLTPIPLVEILPVVAGVII